MVLNEVQKLFKPEFINRLDDLIVFHKLEPKQVRQIADLMLNNLAKRLKESNMILEISKKAKDELAKEGFSEMYGARPLRRLIEDKIENAISMRIINGEFKHGDTIDIGFKKNEYTFIVK
jgi:ATP-dependent Clp protease ATP-binding subunit ClpC